MHLDGTGDCVVRLGDNDGGIVTDDDNWLECESAICVLGADGNSKYVLLCDETLAEALSDGDV